MFNALDISGSALTAQRTRMDIIAANTSNATTTRDSAGNLFASFHSEWLSRSGARSVVPPSTTRTWPVI